MRKIPAKLHYKSGMTRMIEVEVRHTPGEVDYLPWEFNYEGSLFREKKSSASDHVEFDELCTPEEIKRMRNFEHLYQLKLLKEGEPVTKRQIDAIQHFFGDMLAKIPEPQCLGTVHFTEKGQPYTKDGNPLGMQVNGKTPLNVE